MIKSELIKRTITCILGIPLLVCLIFLFPENNHLAFAVFTVLVTEIGCIETGKMLFGKTTLISCLPGIGMILELSGYNSTPFFLFLIILCFTVEIKKGEKENFSVSSDRIAKNILCSVYPSCFMIFILKILRLEKTNSLTIMLFLLLVFSNDIFAYVFGKLFGKSNSGIFKASPKKSIAGFTGGFFCCVTLSIIMFEMFEQSLPACSMYWRVLLGSLMALLSDIGDLAESVLKRSCGVKDSSNIVPGRGGVLDCIDSISVCAPVFYAIIRLI